MSELRHALTTSAILTALVLTTPPLLAQSRDAEPATRAANDAFIKSLPFSDRADFDDAKRGFIATLPDGVIAGPGGRPAFEHKTLCLPAEGRGAGDGQSEPVAAGAAQCGQRPVHGHRARLPGAWPRHRQHDHRRGRHRLDPDRSAAVQRNRQGRARSLSRASPGKARRGGDLQPQPRRSFRRCQGRDIRRGCRLGQGKSDRAGWIHGACGGGEYHRRQRHAAPRPIPIRQHASRWRARAGRYRPRQGAGDRHHLADPAQRRHQAGL